MEGRHTELKAANILINQGVKVQVAAPLFLRLFGKKTITLVIRALSPYALIKVAHEFLQMNIENTGEMDLKEAFKLAKTRSRQMTKIICIAFLAKREKMWLAGIMAWWLSNKITENRLAYLYQLVVVYGGIEDFINTIRLTEATRITMPMNLSPKEKTS